MNERLEAVLREMEEYSDSCAERNRGLAGRIWGWATDIRKALKDSEAANKRDIKAVVDLNEIAMKTAMDEVAKLREENERLKEALKDAIPWACLKCTFWNSRAARCSHGSGMCDQVWKWKRILGEAAK